MSSLTASKSSGTRPTSSSRWRRSIVGWSGSISGISDKAIPVPVGDPRPAIRRTVWPAPAMSAAWLAMTRSTPPMTGSVA
jgi:hypothetical protein